jgi:murein L,D-transpeptidase YcbB/YkuD
MVAFGFPVGTVAEAAQKSTKTSSVKKVSSKKKTSRYSAKAARARRAKLARARAAARAQQLREAQVPRFKMDETGALVPDIRAAAAIIYNPENGQVLWESNSTDQRSIASITKVMTAAVCCTCCSSHPTMPPPVRWRACRRTARKVSSIG